MTIQTQHLDILSLVSGLLSHGLFVQNKANFPCFQSKIEDRPKNKPTYPVNPVNPVKKMKLQNKPNLNNFLITSNFD